MKKELLKPEFIINEFGGTLLKSSNAKSHRPISTSKSMHFVFRSDMAIGHRSFLQKSNRLKILKVLEKHKSKVKLENFIIERGQLQIFFKSKSRSLTINFLRTFTGLVARRMLHAEKACAKLRQKRFWKFRPYSHVLARKKKQALDLIQTYLKEIQVFRADRIPNTS